MERAEVAWERQWRVLEDLTAGPFAEDGDWQHLAQGYSMSVASYGTRDHPEEQIRRAERAAEIFRRLAEANPTVASYERGLAEALATAGGFHGDAGNSGKARAYALRALALLRTLPREQQGAAESLGGLDAERALALCDFRDGHLGEALRHINRAIAICEESVRAFPDSINLQIPFAELPVIRALIELNVGRPEDALGSLHRHRELTEAFLHKYPRRRIVRNHLITGLLLESYILIRVGRLPAAAGAADRAATEIDGLPTPLFSADLFSRGCARPLVRLGPARGTEPPGRAPRPPCECRSRGHRHARSGPEGISTSRPFGDGRQPLARPARAAGLAHGPALPRRPVPARTGLG